MSDVFKTKWRFRANWRGKLILQRQLVWEDDGRAFSKWVDADVGDLMDYYVEHAK